MTKRESKSQLTWIDVKAQLATFDRTALRDRFLSSSAKRDLGLVEGVQDTSWILEVERAITVQQMLNSASFVKTAWTT